MSVGQAKLITGAAAAVEDFSVFLTPGNLFIALPLSGGTGSSRVCTANITGGTGPFTFLWTKESGDDMLISDPTEQQTRFSTNTSQGSSQFAIFKCTVTDSLAAEVSDTVTVVAEQ